MDKAASEESEEEGSSDKPPQLGEFEAKDTREKEDTSNFVSANLDLTLFRKTIKCCYFDVPLHKVSAMQDHFRWRMISYPNFESV